jgi:hypothetical protein
LKLTSTRYFQATSTSNVPLVHVYLDPDRKLFTFPEALLCDEFKFFKAAFQGSFRESVEKTIDLPEDDPAAFSYIIDCALAGGSDMPQKVEVKDVQLALAKAYILADKLGRSDFQDEIRQEYFWLQFNKTPFAVCSRAVRFVYESSPESAPLRQTMVDTAITQYDSVNYLSSEIMEKWLESAISHPKFLADIMITFKQ